MVLVTSCRWTARRLASFEAIATSFFNSHPSGMMMRGCAIFPGIDTGADVVPLPVLVPLLWPDVGCFAVASGSGAGGGSSSSSLSGSDSLIEDALCRGAAPGTASEWTGALLPPLLSERGDSIERGVDEGLTIGPYRHVNDPVPCPNRLVCRCRRYSSASLSSSTSSGFLFATRVGVVSSSSSDSVRQCCFTSFLVYSGSCTCKHAI